MHWQISATWGVNDLAVTDYCGTCHGRLTGRGFNHFDISDKSARDVFEWPARNLDPETGHVMRKHAKDGVRVGIDFTFNAPKSLSPAREWTGPGNKGDTHCHLAAVPIAA